MCTCSAQRSRELRNHGWIPNMHDRNARCCKDFQNSLLCNWQLLSLWAWVCRARLQCVNVPCVGCEIMYSEKPVQSQAGNKAE